VSAQERPIRWQDPAEEIIVFRRIHLHQVMLVLLVVAVFAAPAAVFAESGSTAGVYVVQRGDTLARIAAQHGVSVSSLAAANGIKNSNLVYTGQRLAIPGSAAPAPQADQAAQLASTSAPAASTDQVAQPVSAAQVDEAALAAAAPVAGRWIDINLSKQRLTAYQGRTVVFSGLVSTGIAGKRTPTGRFAIRTKIPSQRMTGPGYNLPGVPYVMYFAGANAIHGAYWHNNFGHPMSHGCVNMRIPEAKWIYNWASIGTPVSVHY
jgi:lipoprotein-anchoring transpeptidase ErfK/SrfK